MLARLALAAWRDHVTGMRGSMVLASVVLPAFLAACAEPVEPNYAYAPQIEPWWAYCCTPVLIAPVHFHPHHFHHHHHHAGGHHAGGHHGGGHHGGGHR